ncbi:MAG: ribosomal protein S18-alanine N-acetyltransferase [Terracidiphilus sp.]|jgi:ribosomal-protein-alanine N-acetyltransferase
MTINPAKIEIRDLAESDLAAIIGFVQLLEEAPHWPSETFSQMLSGEFRSRRIALVAADRGSGEVLGFAVASLVVPEAELENIAVARKAQRRGIGRQILFELVNKLRHAGIQTLHLEVRASNSAAIGLYNSLEFNETGRRPRYYSSPVEDAVLMTCELR